MDLILPNSADKTRWFFLCPPPRIDPVALDLVPWDNKGQWKNQLEINMTWIAIQVWSTVHCAMVQESLISFCCLLWPLQWSLWNPVDVQPHPHLILVVQNSREKLLQNDWKVCRGNTLIWRKIWHKARIASLHVSQKHCMPQGHTFVHGRTTVICMWNPFYRAKALIGSSGNTRKAFVKIPARWSPAEGEPPPSVASSSRRSAVTFGQSQLRMTHSGSPGTQRGVEHVSPESCMCHLRHFWREKNLPPQSGQMRARSCWYNAMALGDNSRQVKYSSDYDWLLMVESCLS